MIYKLTCFAALMMAFSAVINVLGWAAGNPTITGTQALYACCAAMFAGLWLLESKV